MSILRLEHCTSSVHAERIGLVGFERGSYFLPSDHPGAGEALAGHALWAVRRVGGEPVLITCQVDADDLEEAPEARRSILPQRGEVRCVRALPASVIVSIEPVGVAMHERMERLDRKRVEANAAMAEGRRVWGEAMAPLGAKQQALAVMQREIDDFIAANPGLTWREDYRARCRIRDEHRAAWKLADAS